MKDFKELDKRNVFEVEHSTNIINSLNKFAELKGLSA
jgi:hypothetical protein